MADDIITTGAKFLGDVLSAFTEPEKKTAKKTTAAAKKTAAKKTTKSATKSAATTKKSTAKTTATKKTTTKKSAAKTSSKKTLTADSFVIYTGSGKYASYADIMKKIDAAYKDKINTLDVQVKVSEGKAYYVINGSDMGSVDIFR